MNLCMMTLDYPILLTCYLVVNLQLAYAFYLRLSNLHAKAFSRAMAKSNDIPCNALIVGTSLQHTKVSQYNPPQFQFPLIFCLRPQHTRQLIKLLFSALAFDCCLQLSSWLHPYNNYRVMCCFFHASGPRTQLIS